MIRILTILIVPAFAFVSIVSADDDRISGPLWNMMEELKLKRSEYERIGEKEQDQLARLRLLEEQIALSGQLILKIERNIRGLQDAIENSRAELGDANIIAERKKDALYGRLKYAYKTGNRPGWTAVLLSRNPTEILSGLKNMKTILEYDRHLVVSYRELSLSISAGITRLNADMNRLDKLKSDYENELSLRKTTLDTRRKLLDKLRKDKTILANAMDRLEEDTRSISGIFDDLESEKKDTEADREFPGLVDKQGDLIWPVYGPIVRSFGTKKDKRGIKLTNPGIDIKAPYGSRVSAAAPGRVIYVSWLRGYGQFVIVEHGQSYYTLYANLGSVMVDVADEVKAGQIIALVGDSGTLEGSRLHFELRQGKQQLNPVDWLR